MSKEDNALGVFIQRRREEIGLSLRQFAEVAGLNKGHLSRIENGERSPTTESVLAKIAQALDVSIDELRTLALDASSLPPTRAYFRRKLGVDAAQADVLAKLVEDFQASNRREEARDEGIDQN